MRLLALPDVIITFTDNSAFSPQYNVESAALSNYILAGEYLGTSPRVTRGIPVHQEMGGRDGIVTYAHLTRKDGRKGFLAIAAIAGRINNVVRDAELNLRIESYVETKNGAPVLSETYVKKLIMKIANSVRRRRLAGGGH